MNKIAQSLEAVHTHTHTGGYDLENRSDKEIRLNLIYQRIIEKLE